MSHNHPFLNFELLPSALIFEVVVRCGSFRGAAAELGLSPSTVSARVAGLEGSLGVRLLHRTTRSLSLTDAGRTMIDELAPILPQWRAAEDRVRAHAKTPRGVLTVTAPGVIMSRYIVPVAVAFRTRHPELRFVFRTTVATLSLVDESIDVAVRAGPLPPSEYGAKLLWEGVHVAVATPSLLRAHPISTPAEMMRAPALELAGRRPMRDWRDGAGNVVAHEPMVVMETDTVHAHMALLEAGAGLGFLAEFLVSRAIEAGQLERVLPGWVSDPISFHIVTPSARKHGAAVVGFVEALREAFAVSLR